MTGERIVVTGVGLLCPLGDDPAAVHDALLDGRRAVAPLDPSTLDPQADFELPEALTGDAAAAWRPQAAALNGHGPEKHLEGRNLRPLDRTGRLAVAAALLALGDDADPERRQEPAGLTGLALGTLFGSVHTISKFDRKALSSGPARTKPFDFANSVINAAAGQTAIQHGLAGVNATLGGGPTAGLQALAYAADLLRSGRAGAMLAGGADELCFESLYGFERAGLAASADGVAVPFHARRDGFAPSEGAALLRLEPESAARARGAAPRAVLTGAGNAFDPSRGRDPQRAAAAVARAVRQALAEAGLSPADLDCLSLGADGHRAVDWAEAAGVAAALGDAARDLPVTAVKGALGESLGAAGGIQAALLLETFARGTAPGVAGLDDIEPGFPFARLGPEPTAGTFRRGLLTATSWDGGACAVILETPQGPEASR